MEKLTAIILAGGKSSRMGEDKGLMNLNGKPMIAWVLETVSKLTSEIILIANNPEYKKFGFPVYEDEVPEKGPLGGIITGLKASDTEKNWIISCDTPYINADLLNVLMNEVGDYDAVVPVYKNKVHPLIGVYRKSGLSHFEENLHLNNLKIMEILDGIKVNYFQADVFTEENFRNLNAKTDL